MRMAGAGGGGADRRGRERGKRRAGTLRARPSALPLHAPSREATTMSDPTSRRRGDDAPTQGSRPSDTEQLVGDTAASRPLTDAQRVQPAEAASREGPGREGPAERRSDLDDDAEAELGHS
jgi:hypothetical protein